MNPAVVFENVTFSYPESDEPALKDVSLVIPEGSFALVAGRTGSGKSTLLRAINGLVPHFSGGTFEGRVELQGRSTIDQPPRYLAGVVAFVPQDPDASFVLDRVEDELAYAMENLAVPPVTMRRRVEEVLDLMSLAELRDRSVRSLSGGERQRVAVAAALTAGPRILVLDEPTSQLDPQGAEDVLAGLQRLVHDLGLTVVLAEHRLERVAGFADLAIVCDAGSVSAGEPEPTLSEAGLGPPVARLARLAGWAETPLTVRDARQVAHRYRLPEPDLAPRSRQPPVLELVGVGASYGSRTALEDVSLSLSPGEVAALIGRNGAGKTTLLRCATGLHEVSKGTVSIAGDPPEPGRTIALCPQEPGTVLYKDTVVAEVAATFAARGLLDRDKVSDLLNRFGLAAHASDHPRDLSAGEQLLVATAAIVATGASVLLLDEPTRGLDPESKGLLGGFLRDFASRGGAVMFATHDVELVAAVADRVVLLAGGEVIADGSPSEVLGDSHVFSPQMTRVFGPGWLTPEQVARALVPS